MKRQDYIWFVLLIAMLLLWPNIYSLINPPPPPGEAVPAEVEEPGDEAGVIATEAEPAAPADADAAGMVPDAESAAMEAVESVEAVTPDAEPQVPEQRITLANGDVELVFSSRGAGLVSATLANYREFVAQDSLRVSFDFSDAPALAYEGDTPFSIGRGFEVGTPAADNELVFTRASDGLVLQRTITLGEDYRVMVTDTFRNEGTATVEVPDAAIRLGAMEEEKAHPTMYAIPTLGADSLPGAGGVMHWTKKLPARFKQEQEDAQSASMPRSIEWRASGEPLDWAAVKNKYFAQILMPRETGGDGLILYVDREPTPAELEGRASRGKAVVSRVAAAVELMGQTLEPGQTLTREIEYFIGPKDYRLLSQLGYKRDAVMGFDENAYMDFAVVPVAKILLRLLNFIHDHVVASYGVAIMLLTFLIKVLFWPVTHKSTESMRKMSELQPLMAKIREKYKDNPQKQSQEMMALYKEHKVNPLGGCIPMLIQIPVFFGLFVVLRIAIELRFAEFLWIKDLSAPERLIEFGFALPIVGWDALNILPILMTLAMYWQQRLMPAGGDPQQQKIMRIMMPGMMFFMLYNFASGLALYWTTQNVLVIVQQSIYQYRKKHGQTPAKAGATTK